MLRNYIKIAFRNLVKHRLFTGLNVLGLATGIACSILILLWVQDERSYDRFHANGRQVYRIAAEVSGVKCAVVPVPLAEAVKATIPAIKQTTRLAALQTLVTANNRRFEEKQLYYADSNFLNIFSFPLAAGDKRDQLLWRPDGVVLTEKAALKYFGGTAEAMGKPLHIDNSIRGTDLVVTAVLKDPPTNSHLQFDMLVPILQYEAQLNMGEAWGNYDVYTYIRLDDRFTATPASLRSLQQQIEKIQQQNDDTYTASRFFLQPLTSIHLHSNLLLDVKGNGNAQHVTIFSLVALFLLLIACINFMNLSTALSGQRAKEVGLRKTAGALRFQLIAQFLCESVLIALIALTIGLAIASILLPFFNELAAKSITLDLLNWKVLGTLLGITVAVGLVSGSYPAFFLSSFQAVKVLKGVKVLHGRKTFFRNSLVVVQFSISVILMVSTLVVYKQLQYIRQRDIGFNKEQLLYLPIPQVGDLGRNMQAMKAALTQYPALSRYSIVSHLPTYLTTGTTNVVWAGKDPAMQTVFPQLWVDHDFLDVFGMKLKAGRFFSPGFPGDEQHFVVNETCLRTMQLTAEQAIGQSISINDKKGTIIGVVKDFNFKPVQQPIEPLIIKNGVRRTHHTNAHFIVVRTTPATLQAALDQSKTVFREVYKDHPYSFGFVDEELAGLYLTEQRMGKLFNVFSLLSIIISCLGLFGLATFATQKRIKEIGVRKVLGASEAGIVAMLSKDFMQLVLVSWLIAFPVAAWAMNAWLSNFVYRIGLRWWMFALAGFIALVIAFLTISYQSIKAALTNPANSLRSE